MTMILINVYRLFKFFTLGGVSQHGTTKQITSNGSLLYMTQLAGKLIKAKLMRLKSISTT